MTDIIKTAKTIMNHPDTSTNQNGKDFLVLNNDVLDNLYGGGRFLSHHAWQDFLKGLIL
tara:strand:+ start:173 stop:349 length:177 start_codon:yes stop_codon:yes gene_type:complete